MVVPLNTANGKTEAENLLKREIDGGEVFGGLFSEVLGDSEGSGVLDGCGKGSATGKGSMEQTKAPLVRPEA